MTASLTQRTNLSLILNKQIFSFQIYLTVRNVSNKANAPSSRSPMKKERIVKQLRSPEERKIALLRWNKTNKLFFGPAINEKKSVVQEINIGNRNPAEKYVQKTNQPIPIAIWHSCNNISLKETHNKAKVKISLQNDVKNKGNLVDHTNEIFASQSSSDFSSKQTSATPSAVTETELPQTPFYLKDQIIYPFPLILNNKCTKILSEEIQSLPSQKLDLPSVTEVLSKTRSEASETALAAWRKRKIAEIGEEGLEEYMKEIKLVGTMLHSSIETCLRGVAYENVLVEPRTSGHWLSLKNFLKELEGVVAIETHVVHPHLKYKGLVDCVAHYKGSLVVVDWKTSQRIKASLNAAYDDPVQIAAYVGALNADDSYPFEVENALLVVAYPTGRSADVLVLDRQKCHQYWFEWLKRLELYLDRKRKGLLNSQS